MSIKKLVILLVIFFVISLAAVFVKLSESKPLSIIIETGYIDIAEKGFLISDVAWFEIWKEGSEKEKISINRKKEEWVVGTKFDAPADVEKVEKFLNMYKGLIGKVRSRKEEVLDDYGLGKTAIHFRIVKKEGKGDPVEILIGKDSKFIRRKDDIAVYSVDAEFTNEMGIYQSENTDPPEATEWLEKDILKMDKDTVTKISVTYPDKKIVFEKVEKKAPEDEKSEEEETGDEGESEEEEEEEEEKEKEYEWKVITGIPEGLEPKTNPANKILNRLASLSCNDAVDPEKKGEYGFDKSEFILIAETDDGKETRIQGGFPDPSGNGYVILSETGSQVYQVAGWSFKSLFPKGDEIFDGLPRSGIDEDKITEVMVRNLRNKEFRIEKDGDSVSIVSPRTTLKQKESEIKKILSGLDSLRTEDFSTEPASAEQLGLVNPRARVEVVLKDGTTKKIIVGNDSRTMDGYYIQFEGDDTVYVARTTTIDKIFPKMKELFEDELMKLRRSEIKGVEIVSSTEKISLTKDKEGWEGIENGTSFEVNAASVNTYLNYYNPLKIRDFLLKEGSKLLSTITLTLDDEEKKLFLKMDEEENVYTLTLDSMDDIHYKIDKMTYERLAALFIKFRKEQTEEDGEKEGGPEQKVEEKDDNEKQKEEEGSIIPSVE